MIDPATGELRLPSADVVLGPRLTRESFLASRLAEHARILVVNEPHCRYVVSVPPGEPGEMAWRVSLQFHGPSLVSLDLGASDARFGTSWDDWTEEKQQALRRYHDEWLERTCGLKPGRYSWGELESGVTDPKGGTSSILVRYR